MAGGALCSLTSTLPALGLPVPNYASEDPSSRRMKAMADRQHHGPVPVGDPIPLRHPDHGPGPQQTTEVPVTLLVGLRARSASRPVRSSSVRRSGRRVSHPVSSAVSAHTNPRAKSANDQNRCMTILFSHRRRGAYLGACSTEMLFPAPRRHRRSLSSDRWSTWLLSLIETTDPVYRISHSSTRSFPKGARRY
jgi:hypothetical protein